MKKIVTLSAIAFLSTAVFAATDTSTKSDADRISALEKKIAKLEKGQTKNKKKISAVNKLANKDNIKFDVDFRTSYDNIEYKSKNKNYSNGIYSMRLWLNMGYAPTDSMMFKGQLAFNKAFGASYKQRGTGQGFDTFDWIVNENSTDDKVRVREAYWFWSPSAFGRDWTVSVGRRPATNGFLVNLRDDDKAKSPIGHIINMEFDGASVTMKTDDLLEGSYLKVCLGRGLTNASSRFNMTSPDYDDNGGLSNMDLIGVIAKIYDNGQYTAFAKYYKAVNVLGMKDANKNNRYDHDDDTMKTYGDMDGAALSFQIAGIGDEINDFLDETTFFASYAWSQSDPKSNQAMMGSTKRESGDSIYVGLQTPNLTGGKFGMEYNHGSQYWRPFTYGEDTMIGSKLAVRGNAYEAYWTQPIIDKMFTMQVRYTYLDYDYTGSQGFMGDFGTPVKISDNPNAIDTAQDIRVYFRYRY